MSEVSSHRQILRSTSIIGGASVINVLIGLLRTKVAAVLLGPAGIGLIGLLQNLVTAASTVAALGFSNVGTRQIAEAAGRDDVDAIAAARRALFWGTLILAVIGSVVFWSLKDLFAAQVLGDAGLAKEIGWLALAVALTVAAGSQMALLNGLRRVGDIACVTVLSALLGTVLGVGALWVWGERGLLIFVLSLPLAGFLIGHIYVARLPKVRALRTSLSQLLNQWGILARLGAAFVLAGLALVLGQLAVRMLVQRELGEVALGHFQAAWMISMTYIGFILTAMGTDYYPRLTAIINDHAAVNRMVNEQTEVALLLSGPILLAMLGLAPWVIDLLYSHLFGEAVAVLRWQVIGDVCKIASFPLGFIILATGSGSTFVISESIAVGVFVSLTWIGLPYVGIQMTGMAFLGMYLIYLSLVYCLARRRTGFRWVGRVRMQLVRLTLAALVVHLLAGWSDRVGAISGVLASFTFGVYALIHLGGLNDSAAPIVARVRDSLAYLSRRRGR